VLQRRLLLKWRSRRRRKRRRRRRRCCRELQGLGRNWRWIMHNKLIRFIP
jgi:hypothetical protein